MPVSREQRDNLLMDEELIFVVTVLSSLEAVSGEKHSGLLPKGTTRRGECKCNVSRSSNLEEMGGIGDSGGSLKPLSSCNTNLCSVHSASISRTFSCHTDTRFLWGSRPGCWKHNFLLQAPWLPPCHGPLVISVGLEKPTLCPSNELWKIWRKGPGRESSPWVDKVEESVVNNADAWTIWLSA